MKPKEFFNQLLNRRTFLLGLGASAGAIGLMGAGSPLAQNKAVAMQEPIKDFVYQGHHSADHTDHLGPALRSVSPQTKKLDPMGFLTRFDYGQVSKGAKGQTIRDYTVVASEADVEIAEDVGFSGWMFNGNIPGPTLRCTQGDYVRIRFINQTERRHSMHFHGIRPSEVDGITPIQPSAEFVYEFTAEPFGLFPYHCHVRPVNEHVQRGLYGLLIVDPPTPRPSAHELVMVLNGYDVNSDLKNDLYTINGVAEYFMDQPIRLRQYELVRVYLLNMTEFDPLVSLHIHANTADLYFGDGALQPNRRTDIFPLGHAERAIVEFSYRFPGRYMFHPHQNLIAEHGAVGFFEVVPQPGEQLEEDKSNSDH
ncbi:multicopper oxidase domain-containing protein [Candidatus Acetothermia bacterium]|nr:multicopper oxidase domain-containing protein [Candidatus Acetothermia bacterium]